MKVDSRFQELMSEAAEAYCRSCFSDPDFQVGMLAASPHFSSRVTGDSWCVMAWTGKDKKVRGQSIPRGVNVARVAGAIRTEDVKANFVMWQVGRRPKTGKAVVRMFADTEDPQILSTPNDWALDQMAAFASDLNEGDVAPRPRRLPRWMRLPAWRRRDSRG